jgi:hypothetical protein
MFELSDKLFSPRELLGEQELQDGSFLGKERTRHTSEDRRSVWASIQERLSSGGPSGRGDVNSHRWQREGLDGSEDFLRHLIGTVSVIRPRGI